jgi:NTP pyrophosphatase (non-canonical NTP hydrolase)
MSRPSEKRPKTPLNLADIDRVLREINRERGWDLVPASTTMVHLLEELGELAELIPKIGEVTTKLEDEAYSSHLAGEMGDAVLLLLKLAHTFGVDIPSAVQDCTGSLDFSDWAKANPDIPKFTSHQMSLFGIWLLEHLGELSRHIMFFERFKDPGIRKANRADVSVELAHLIVALVGTPQGMGIDMSNLLEDKLQHVIRRFPSRAGNKETLRYLEHGQAEIERCLREYRARFQS